ncbi:MAG: hypothetical protein AAB308_11670 [Nitrospirota bacterium]
MNTWMVLNRWRHMVGAGLLLLIVAVVNASFVFPQGVPIMVGITPLTSKVADIPAEEAQELFINALMETNSFAIKPPDANGSYAGAAYVFEPIISEAKAQSNVLGLLKDVATSKTPISLTVRVFDPRTNALMKSVTVKSTDAGNAQVNLGDVQSLMGAFGAGKGQEGEKGGQPDPSAQLEERIGGLMQQAATRLAAQVGMPAAGQRPGTRR